MMSSLRATLINLYFPIGIVVSAASQVNLLITPPPTTAPTHCATAELLRRDESCEFGQCGTLCLNQGAFCCGPAGTLATAPLWICDNGACVTSVKGATGVVDCYDPDNPSATTQSCIDYIPTATCNPTDRCYTCSSNQPFCHWQTYIASGSPTLRWFSCIETSTADETLLAVTITNNLLTAGTSSTSQTSTSTSKPSSSRTLSTGAIVGISAGGATLLITLVVLLTWYCVKKRKSASAPISVAPPPPGSAELSSVTPQTRFPPAELDNTPPPMYYSGRHNKYGQPAARTTEDYDAGYGYGEAISTEGRSYAPNNGGAEMEMLRQGVGAPMDRVVELPSGQKQSVVQRRPAPEMEEVRHSYVEGDDFAHMTSAARI